MNPSMRLTEIVKRLGRTASIAACLAWPLLASSCQTTGDPSSGGIFWSERKAQQRIDERQDKLGRIDDQAAHARKSGDAKQREAARLQQ